MLRRAFTLMEMIFVIVVIGILANFGVEAMMSAYESFIFNSIHSRLQDQSESAARQIANRLEYRIKNSVIGRQGGAWSTFKPLPDIQAAEGAGYTTLEWIAIDREGWLGTTIPLWSGFIDVNHPNANRNLLVSPDTDAGALDGVINALSNGGSSIRDVAIFFPGQSVDVRNGFGWVAGGIADQNQSIHPVTPAGSTFVPTGSDLGGVEVFETYQLAWTAYAVVHNTANERLRLCYNYQPWNNESFGGTCQTLMENVDTFKFQSNGDIVKIQVCVNDNIMEDYSVCKELTIM